MKVGGGAYVHTHTHTRTLVEMSVEDMYRLKWCGSSGVDGGEDARGTRTALDARGPVVRRTGFGIMPVKK